MKYFKTYAEIQFFIGPYRQSLSFLQRGKWFVRRGSLGAECPVVCSAIPPTLQKVKTICILYDIKVTEWLIFCGMSLAEWCCDQSLCVRFLRLVYKKK